MPNRPATVRARGLGAELREFRNKTGMSVREVANRLGWSPATLSRTENGLRAATLEETAALLVLYDIKGVQRERLLGLARDASLPGWWETGASLPAQLPALIAFESEATRITAVELMGVPGLMQTADYTRAQMRAAQVAPQEIETRVYVRLGRQAVLTRPDPLRYLAILDEAALRRQVGGRGVMAEQLRHLVKLAGRPNITVQVIPFARGAHSAMSGGYHLLEFAKAGSIVHLEHKRSSLFLDDPRDVAPFVSGSETLRQMALDPLRSVEFAAALAAEYER